MGLEKGEKTLWDVPEFRTGFAGKAGFRRCQNNALTTVLLVKKIIGYIPKLLVGLALASGGAVIYLVLVLGV